MIIQDHLKSKLETKKKFVEKCIRNRDKKCERNYIYKNS